MVDSNSRFSSSALLIQNDTADVLTSEEQLRRSHKCERLIYERLLEVFETVLGRLL